MNKQKNMSIKSIIPGGIIALMVWQVVVVIYCGLYLWTFRNTVDLAGTVFGISDPYILQMFFIIVAFTSTISFVGIKQRFNWGRWLYIISLMTVIIVKIIYTVFVVYSESFKYFFDRFTIGEFNILLINLIIILYLIRSKKVKAYF